MAALHHYLSIADLERAARRRMPACVRGYVCGGTEDGVSLQQSLQAFSRLGFVPRGLRHVAQRSTATSLWGQTYSLPMGFAPTGFAAIVMKDCDAALAKVAQAQALPFIISGASTVPLEQLQSAHGQRCWYQAYLPGNMARILPLLQRLEKAQVPVLVITIDTCVGANRENLQRLRFTVPFRPSWRLLLDGLRHPRWSCDVFLRTVLSQGVPRFANLAHEAGPAITADPPTAFGASATSSTGTALTRYAPPGRASWCSRVSCTRMTPGSPWPTGQMPSSSPPMAGASSIPASRRCRRCPRFGRPCRPIFRCLSMAAFAGAAMCSRPWHWALIWSLPAGRSCLARPWLARRALPMRCSCSARS